MRFLKYLAAILSRQRVEAARQVQAARFAPVNKPNMLVNGDMGPAELNYCLSSVHVYKPGTATAIFITAREMGPRSGHIIIYSNCPAQLGCVQD